MNGTIVCFMSFFQSGHQTDTISFKTPIGRRLASHLPMTGFENGGWKYKKVWFQNKDPFGTHKPAMDNYSALCDDPCTVQGPSQGPL